MNKYGNKYIQSISKAIGEYKPFNQIESVTKGLPVAAAGGAGLGGLIGGVEGLVDPGYDERGNVKNRLKGFIDGMIHKGLTFGTIAGLGSAAMPSLLQSSIRGATNLAKRNLDEKIMGSPLLDKATRDMNTIKINAQYKRMSNAIPQMTSNQLFELLKSIDRQPKTRQNIRGLIDLISQRI